MLYKKEGLPAEGELVICTVTKIHPTSVFVKLDHYDNEQAMLHISEVAPGRIRNLSEYVSMGKMLVCQVLTLEHKRGHIDLSLRRVSEARRIKKLSELKQELKAEKILEQAADELKTDFKKLYEKSSKKVLEKYEYVYKFFQDVVKGDTDYSLMALTSKQEDVISKLVATRIKPPIMEINGEFTFKTHAGDGLEIVKKTMTAVEKVDKSLTLKCNGGGRYAFVIASETFEHCEKVLKKALSIFEPFEKDKLVEFSYQRSEGKQVEV